jgi:hypothetical protein
MPSVKLAWILELNPLIGLQRVRDTSWLLQGHSLREQRVYRCARHTHRWVSYHPLPSQLLGWDFPIMRPKCRETALAELNSASFAARKGNG